MPKTDLGGSWQGWVDPAAADEFYKPEFAAEPEHLLPVPGHWQLIPELRDHRGPVFYRRVFDWKPTFRWPVMRLCLGGAFSVAGAWLNGQKLGESDAYYAPMIWELRPEQLQAENNVLAILLQDPLDDLNTDLTLGVYGVWDSKPIGVNPGGIWSTVELWESSRGFLRSQELNAQRTAWNSAQIKLKAELVWRSLAGRVQARLEVTPRNFQGKKASHNYDLTVQPGTNTLDLRLTLPEPKLWWTWDQGQPHLYDVRLQINDEEEQVVDTFSTYLGIRDLAFENWRFSLNGRSVFLRGANYGPISFHPASVTLADIQSDVSLLLDCNLNLVRVYNHVARPEFYALCAEAGIAVWQDFPLNKKQEHGIMDRALDGIGQMVTSLRHEPAICFWSCHNEPYAEPGEPRGGVRGALAAFQKTYSNIRPSWNKDILDAKLQEAVLQLDDTRPVVRNSGVLGLIRGGSATHHYLGWSSPDYRSLIAAARYFPRIIRFVNEYGAQSISTDPEFLESLEETGGDWNEFNWHAAEKEFLADVELLKARVPTHAYSGIGDYAIATQEYQAEILQFYHEFLRRHKYHPVGGAVFYHFADPWPVISHSVLDEKRQPKLAYFATRRAMQPVLAMIEWPKAVYHPGETWSSPIYLVNDLPRPLPTLGLDWRLTFGDDLIIRDRGVAEIDADEVRRIGTLTLPIPEHIAAESVLTLELVLTLSNGEKISNEYRIRVKPWAN